MSAKSDLLDHVAPLLADGERVVALTTVQVKGGAKRDFAKKTLAGAAASMATLAATGGTVGLLVTVVPPAAWFVGTTERVMLVERTAMGAGIGRTIFMAPRAALQVRLKSLLLNEITLADPSDGQSLVRLNVGVKKGAAKQIVAAVEGTADGSL
ncbi:hypothetical protein ICW40_01795 [Actinotalea ferrariae]|uniref:hypothetical protein n=1 Tax=Actinotalea ferrariae TaxID=1386098 RepID=UPI001C8C7A5C|nr:hypothetical protein [Actinotalea ferrariae]MBX9243538.1 hypothetical protein [Actinotalea ferrariae]